MVEVITYLQNFARFLPFSSPTLVCFVAQITACFLNLTEELGGFVIIEYCWAYWS